MRSLFLLALLAPQAGQERVVVGSKAFPESHLLGELFALLLEEHTDLEVEHRSGLGGTLICHAALVEGAIDLYPEYTGTAWSVVLGRTERATDPLRVFLEVQAEYRARYDLEWTAPLGFENTYVLAMDAERAAELGIQSLSDLARHPDLAAGFSHEFVERDDGYSGLREHYGLALEARGMEHALAYAALAGGEVDLIDAYSTDGELLRYGLVQLQDDREFFPPYDAAPVVRRELLARHPEVGRALALVAYRLTEAEMTRMNHRVEAEGSSFRQTARAFLAGEGLLRESAPEHTTAQPARPAGFLAFFAARRGETLRLLLEHVGLTALAVLLASLVAIPLGLLGARRPLVARIGLGAAGLLQTVPSLALLAVLIAVPGLGLTWRSAVFALFVYALLPILRNTITGVRDVDPDVVDAARGLGLTERELLLRVRLPLATRTILAGVRTATVISVGVATLAAFIGAGGLGEPIVTGLYLNDPRLILSGALPAAGLALLLDALFGALEHALTPRALRR